MRAPSILRAVLTFLLFSLPRPEGNAQATGTIAGTVVDPQGGAIAGAHITMIEDSTGMSYDTATNCSGLYRRTDLPAGGYHLRLEAQGFRPETKSFVPVSPSQITQFESRLWVGTAYGGPVLEVEDKTQPMGAIFGTVIDHIGAPVPARITATEKKSAAHYETTTDSQGIYRLSNLPEGNYRLRFEGAHFNSDPGQELFVKPSSLTCSDLRMPDDWETVEICTASCAIKTITAPVTPVHTGVELQVYAPSNFIVLGSQLWLTVTLTNTMSHPILVSTDKHSGAAFVYQVYHDGPCGCTGLLRRHDTGDGKQLATNESPGLIHRVLPGGTLTDRVDLRTMTGFPWLGTYEIGVERPDTSSEGNCCEEPKNPPMVRSNQIKLTVVAPR